VFRSVDRPSYDSVVQEQLATARATVTETPEQQLAGLLNSGDTWTIV
ncbi:2-oxoacid:ferredoxin oxidoreductase subunit beta, partial [Micromonospora sp. NPDC049799]